MTEQDKHHPTQQLNLILSGMTAALPIVLGYLPIGFAYGVLAQKAGLSTFATVLMSLVVFAGSAQLIAVGLISAGLSPLAIIMTTFVVNLRHLLFSAAIYPHLARWRKRELAAFAFELTDETFALHATRFDLGSAQKGEAFAINLTAHTAWIIGGGLGALAGRMVADIERFGLDYALPAMFIALLVMQTRKPAQVWAAVFGGVLSVGLLLMGLDQWHVILATIIGAAIGAWIEAWKKIPS